VTVPLIILAALSVLGGLLNLPGVSTLEHWLANTLGESSTAGFLWAVAGTSLLIALLGLGLAWLVYGRKPLEKDQADPLQSKLGGLYTGMQHKWWVDEFYAFLILNPFKEHAEFTAQKVDQGIINRAGDGLGTGANALGTWLRRFQNGHVRSYALWMLVGLTVILTFLVLR
jgi:NADH-quinone oxidoreductase subunit L